jgi:hypothetical protein
MFEGSHPLRVIGRHFALQSPCPLNPKSGQTGGVRERGQYVTRFSKRFLVIDRVVCVRSLQKYFFSFDEGGGVKKCLGDVDCRAWGSLVLLNVQIFLRAGIGPNVQSVYMLKHEAARQKIGRTARHT